MNTSLVQDTVISQALPVLESFYNAVVACDRQPLFRPSFIIASTPEATRYDPIARAIILVPYEVLPPARQAAMDRFAMIGTLGLSGREQYMEVFNHLLIAHELGHWVQEMTQQPLNRWQAEYQANEIMVAFWREYPTSPPSAATEKRLANFVVQPQNMPNPIPDDLNTSIETYFNTNISEIEANPMVYASFQKMMVRQVIAEKPEPSFHQLITTAWPLQ